jgi:tetratricopeptide (TPR) repeat protein
VRANPRLVLVFLTALAWGGVLGGSFQFDDFPTIVADPATVDARALLARVSTGIRPLLRLSYFLDHLLWGMRPAGFLLTNLLLHLATVLGVFELARRLLRDEAAAFLAAAIFVLQPANAEVVAYVTGRSTGLMVAFFIWALVRWEDGRRASALLLFAAAGLSKEVALVFPAFLAVRELTRSSATGLRWLAPAAALAAVILGVLALSPRYRELLAFSLDLRPPLANLGPALRSAGVMVSLWVRPWALAVDHGPPPESALLTFLALSVVGAAAAVAIAMRRREPLVTICVAWPLLALAPTNSLIAKLDLVTEKPLYLAWVGPSILLGMLLARPAIAWTRARSTRKPEGRPRRLVAATALLCAWAVFVPARVRIWSDARLLWGDSVRKAPDRARAWNNLGLALWTEGQDREAALALEESLRLDPRGSSASVQLWLIKRRLDR